MGTGPGQTNLVKTILRPGIDETNKESEGIKYLLAENTSEGGGDAFEKCVLNCWIDGG